MIYPLGVSCKSNFTGCKALFLIEKEPTPQTAKAVYGVTSLGTLPGRLLLHFVVVIGIDSLDTVHKES